MKKKFPLFVAFWLFSGAIFSQTQTPVYLLSQSISNSNTKGFYQYLPVANKTIRVNVSDGILSFNHPKWNNWQATANANSATFKYEDGAQSSVLVNISSYTNYRDNGANYAPGAIICPPEVLRINSTGTSIRYLAISGLNPSLLYGFEFYGSRGNPTGSKSIFKTGNAADTIDTDFNINDFAKLNNIIPDKTGKVIVTLSFIGTYHYLAGFSIIESGTPIIIDPGAPTIFANAGVDLKLILPMDSAILNGCNSSISDNTPLKYKWRNISGPAGFLINSDTLCSVKLKNLIAGSYAFELMVSNTAGLSNKDTVVVEVNLPITMKWPELPLPLCPQPFKIVILGSSTAAGTGATPIDSSWVNKFRSYTQRQNPQVIVTNLSLGGYNSYHICPSDFVPPANKPLPDPNRNITAALALNPDAIIINLPSNDAASGFTLKESQDNFNLMAAVSDKRGIPLWVTTSQPRSFLSTGQETLLVQFKDWVKQRFANKAIDFWTDIANLDNSVNNTFSFGDGIHLNNYGHHLVFTRVLEEKIWDSICVRRNIIPNLPPVANAGADLFAFNKTSLTLNGANSYDPEGQDLTYNWRIILNPSGTGNLTNSNSDRPVFSTSNSGIYNIELTVLDTYQLSSRDTLTIYVSAPNILPIAKAGADTVLQSPLNNASLNGSLSFDADGTIIKYKWKQIQGLPSIISNDSIIDPIITGLSRGNYLFELTVTDDSLAINKDTVALLINIQPKANAGADITITLPNNSVSVSGTSSSDLDGIITTYNWTKINGPVNFTIINSGAPQTNITFSNSGQYLFELSVFDNNGGVGKDSLMIIVKDDPRIPPVADAGPDKSLQLPTNRVLLDGRASSDANGAISTYLWAYIGGPSGSQLLSNDKDTCTAVLLNAGTYIFRLTVTNNLGLSRTDDVQIILLPLAISNTTIRVNVSDGIWTYNNPKWNNWQATANINSTTFKYEDGTQSSVLVNISSYTNYRDNGANYTPGATICPPEVLRINSTGTSVRYLTVSGLNPSKQYKFEFYGSRGNPTGSKSIFKTGNAADTIDTDFNINDFAKLNNIIPDKTGKVIVTLSFIGTYHYLAGFSIIEPGSSPIITNRSGNVNQNSTQLISEFDSPGMGRELHVYPNPFIDRISIKIPDAKAGDYNLIITDAIGKTIWIKNFSKKKGNGIESIQIKDLKKGIYFLKYTTKENQSIKKLLKL